MDVCNVSMGTTKRSFFAALHNLADRAYFRNTVLVTAANMPHADG
jgi:subtilisin